MNEPVANQSVVVLPYLEAHNGPQRTLWVRFDYKWRLGVSPTNATISIDGRSYLGAAPLAAFRIPADRPTHVGIQALQNTNSGTVAVADSQILLPGAEDVQMSVVVTGVKEIEISVDPVV